MSSQQKSIQFELENWFRPYALDGVVDFDVPIVELVDGDPDAIDMEFWYFLKEKYDKDFSPWDFYHCVTLNDYIEHLSQVIQNGSIDYETNINDYTQKITTNPKDLANYHERAVLLMQSKRYDDALHDINRVLDNKPCHNSSRDLRKEIIKRKKGKVETIYDKYITNIVMVIAIVTLLVCILTNSSIIFIFIFVVFTFIYSGKQLKRYIRNKIYNMRAKKQIQNQSYINDSHLPYTKDKMISAWFDIVTLYALGADSIRSRREMKTSLKYIEAKKISNVVKTYGKELDVWLDPDEISQCKSFSDLIHLAKKKYYHASGYTLSAMLE